jgi:hypothetical protein
VHRQPGYEAWKDEKKFHGPQWRVIFLIVGSIFVSGMLCTTVAFFAFRDRLPGNNLVAGLPTAGSLPTITTTATQRFNVFVSESGPASPTATPSSTPTATATPLYTETPNLAATMDALIAERSTDEPTEPPDLAATMDYLLSQRELVKDELVSGPTESTATASATPFTCVGAPFQSYQVNEELTVTLTGAKLRLLTAPRVDGAEPRVVRLLDTGARLTVTGESICGAWQGRPVVYWPILTARGEPGWVGVGRADEIWLRRSE